MMGTAWEARTKLLTINEAAQILNIRINTLKSWCDQGIIPAFRIGPSTDRCLLESDVNFLNTRIHQNCKT